MDLRTWLGPSRPSPSPTVAGRPSASTMPSVDISISLKNSSVPHRRSFLHSLFCYLRQVEKSFVEFYPIRDSCSIKRFALLLQLLKSNGRSLNANLRLSNLSQIMKTETCGIFNDSFTNLYLQVCEYSSFYTTCRHNTL